MNVYYWRTWYKAVCGGKGESEGHVLRDTTSRGLRGESDHLGMYVYYCRTYDLWPLEGVLSSHSH